MSLTQRPVDPNVPKPVLRAGSWQVRAASRSTALTSQKQVQESFPTYNLDEHVFKKWLAEEKYKIREIGNFHVENGYYKFNVPYLLSPEDKSYIVAKLRSLRPPSPTQPSRESPERSSVAAGETGVQP